MGALIWSPVHSQMLSGDIAKNFKNEAPRHKDLASLRAGANTPEYMSAMYLVREALQNSVDSSRDPEFLGWRGRRGEDLGAPFEVTFRLVDMFGAEKAKMEDLLGISELRGLVEAEGTEWLGGTPSPEVREALKKTSGNRPLTLLFIEEHNSSGMYSRDEADLTESKMLIAMYSHNISDKDGTGSGGSFGHGKSALAAASLMRMNLAYSNYAWRGADGAALLGAAYYPMHRTGPGEDKRTGFAFLSDGRDSTTGFPKPFLRADAHRMAADLGFAPRTEAGDCGTTMMIVAPAFDAERLEQAVADHWWPAICSGRLRVNLVREVRGGRASMPPVTGVVDPTDYRKHPGLEGYPEALTTAITPGDPKALLWEFPDLGTFSAGIVSSSTRPRAQASGSASRHIVAYVRGLGMVAFYRSQAAGSLKGQRETRGLLLVTDSKTNELFRMSEPKTHDAWVRNASGLHEADRKMLRDQHLQMSRGVRDAVSEIVTSERDADGAAKSSELLSALLGPLLRPGKVRGSKTQRTPAGPLRVETLGRSVVDESAGTVTLRIRVTHDLGAGDVTLRATLSVASEGGKAPEWLPTGVTVDGVALPAEEVQASGGVFSVRLLQPSAASGPDGQATGPATAEVTLMVCGPDLPSREDLSGGSASTTRPLHTLWSERLRPEWKVEVEG